MDIGFNIGQAYSFIASKHGKTDRLPNEVLKEITSVSPKEWLSHLRFSGTLSNYMNNHELGFGEHPETWTQWQILSNRLNIIEKIGYALAVLTKNHKKAIDYNKKFVGSSFNTNFINTYHQLGSKTASFTFNSHMPFRGLHTLEQSLDSLMSVYRGVNLTHIELENEGYYAAHIWEKRRDEYFDYLLNVVVPAIEKRLGRKDIPMGVTIAKNNTTPRYQEWNKKSIELANKLKERGYKPFFVCHIYLDNESKMEAELSAQLDFLPKDFPIRITEFNLGYEGKQTQSEVVSFVQKFAEIASRKGVEAVFYHSIYTSKGALYSFVK